MNVKIIYESAEILNQNNLKITYNNKEKNNLKIFDDVIEFESADKFGYSMMTISSQKNITIKDVRIDDNSIREMIYLSFLLDKDKKLQPRTTLQNCTQIWCMPIIYPLSAFFSFCQNNIPNGYLGKNLFDYFDLFFPESIEISRSHPKVLRDYFFYDSHFSVIPKHSICDKYLQKPFVETDGFYDFEKVLAEIRKNLSLIDFIKDKPHQYSKNNVEFDVKNPWKKSYFLKSTDSSTYTENKGNSSPWRERFLWKKTEWNCLFELLECLPAKNILNGFLAELPPGAFIFPHNDNRDEKYFKTNNPSVMYIPLSSPDHVFFKFANFGLVNLKKTNLIDNRRFSHAVVNDSAKPRYILNINFYAN